MKVGGNSDQIEHVDIKDEMAQVSINQNGAPIGVIENDRIGPIALGHRPTSDTLGGVAIRHIYLVSLPLAFADSSSAIGWRNFGS